MIIADVITQTDLSRVKDKLVQQQKCSAVQAEGRILGYQRFLTLHKQYPGEIFVPSEAIDAVWHLHLEDDEAYKNDCQRLFGAFLIHDPSFYDTPEFETACQFTRKKYIQNFNVDLQAEEAPAMCGGMIWAACGGRVSTQVEGWAHSS